MQPLNIKLTSQSKAKYLQIADALRESITVPNEEAYRTKSVAMVPLHLIISKPAMPRSFKNYAFMGFQKLLGCPRSAAGRKIAFSPSAAVFFPVRDALAGLRL